MSKLADVYLALKEQEKILAANLEITRDAILAAVAAGNVVVSSDGQMATVSERVAVTYRTKEVLALLRREKLDAGRFVSVKAAEIRKLDATLIADLPFSEKATPVLTFRKD